MVTLRPPTELYYEFVLLTLRATVLTLVIVTLLVTSSLGGELESVPIRTLDSHCPFNPPETLEQWQKRADDLRLQLTVSQGLHPYPALDPVSPQIDDRREMEGYSVEKCIFESLPGLWVTGTLYRPLVAANDRQAEAGKMPGILCPHGHWANGRFHQANDVSRQLASGAERFEAAALNPMQARCVQLARMGCVVYQYDMLGYADSRQISFNRAHGFASQPVDQEQTEEGWLLYSPLAEMNAQSIMGLQTLATQRAVDMLLSLPDVDPARIGITGASGGGTQSFIAAAIDSRIAVSFPAVMVSTGMQGGCTCENASLLRIGTGNVEIAALFAPRPMGLTAADDWTRTMPGDGFPELKKIYRLNGHPERVALFPSLHFGHNYNHVSRVSLYGWINDHFNLGYSQPILESDFTLLTADDLTVWDEIKKPAPESGEHVERQLMKLWADIVQTQLTGLKRGDRQQKALYLQNLHDGWRVVLGLTSGSAVESEVATFIEMAQLNSDNNSDNSAILISSGDVESWAYLPNTAAQELVNNGRAAAGYTYGYNHCQFVRQAQRLGNSLLRAAGGQDGQKIKIQASGPSAALAAAAIFCANELAYQSEQISPAWEMDLNFSDFRFAAVRSLRDAWFVPGSVRYGDVDGLMESLQYARTE
jgi:dienelactone hydrolase